MFKKADEPIQKNYDVSTRHVQKVCFVLRQVRATLFVKCFNEFCIPHLGFDIIPFNVKASAILWNKFLNIVLLIEVCHPSLKPTSLAAAARTICAAKVFYIDFVK